MGKREKQTYLERPCLVRWLVRHIGENPAHLEFVDWLKNEWDFPRTTSDILMRDYLLKVKAPPRIVAAYEATYLNYAKAVKRLLTKRDEYELRIDGV